jgi:hypothetical protein
VVEWPLAVLHKVALMDTDNHGHYNLTLAKTHLYLPHLPSIPNYTTTKPYPTITNMYV